MFSLSGFNLSCTWQKLGFIVMLLAICLFIYLGIWQIQRAHEKEGMLKQYAELNQKEPKSLNDFNTYPSQYQTIKVNGRYLNTVFLLDNQFFNHQFGYYVFSPLLLENNKIILIDRGWVQGDISRQKLPTINIPESSLSLIGSIYYPSKKGLILGNVLEKKQQNILVVEKIDMNLFKQTLHGAIYPFIIRLNKNEPYGYTREWPIVSMPPTRHYGYAVQWFGFASIIVIFFFGSIFRKKS